MVNALTFPRMSRISGFVSCNPARASFYKLVRLPNESISHFQPTTINQSPLTFEKIPVVGSDQYLYHIADDGIMVCNLPQARVRTYGVIICTGLALLDTKTRVGAVIHVSFPTDVERSIKFALKQMETNQDHLQIGISGLSEYSRETVLYVREKAMRFGELMVNLAGQSADIGIDLSKNQIIAF